MLEFKRCFRKHVFSDDALRWFWLESIRLSIRPRSCALAAKTGADPAGFHFAYGSPKATNKVLRDYAIDVHYHGARHTDPDHTVVSYLIDAHSRIRYDFAPQYPPTAIARITQRLVDSR